MCGFAGVVGKNMQSNLHAMNQRLIHRGPDSHGKFFEDDVGICHRRLEILGLGNIGYQPMRSPSGRYVLAFNGEIYNHLKLRERNSLAATAWRGSSDTETICVLLDEMPIERVFSSLDGMFAAVVWDRQEKKLHVIRDRFGIKPAYYAKLKKVFGFASTPEALRPLLGRSPEINRQALDDLLTYGHIPGSRTIDESISEVLPGEIVTFCMETSILTHRVFADLVQDAMDEYLGSDRSSALSIDDLHSVLSGAVRDTALADVEVGALLSGGVDSQLVAGLLAKNQPSIHTFTVGFEDSDLDESTYSHAASQAIGSRHNLRFLRESNALEWAELYSIAFGEPFGDSSALPTLALSELASETVKVVLTGDGGDELFGGYQTYAIVQADLAARPQVSRDEEARFIRGFYQSRAAGIVIDGNESVQFEEWRNRWDRLSFVEEPWLRMMLYDTVNQLPFGILHKVDRATMHFGLEARPPLLTLPVFKLAWKIHAQGETADVGAKTPLRTILQNIIPSSAQVPTKKGLSLPLAAWLQGPIIGWAQELLDTNAIQRDGLLDHHMVDALWQKLLRGERVSYSLWSVLAFMRWRLACT